jgi:hypothetical protein
MKTNKFGPNQTGEILREEFMPPPGFLAMRGRGGSSYKSSLAETFVL